ncbi:MAG: hypothetical protein ABWY06_04930 [Pseudomonas sp.]|uniref:hypothetical protein n=1 Tax=Pseudomonas sp. TaxID=306 RepID=UPI003392A940
MLKLLKWALLSVVVVAALIKLSLWLAVRSIMNDAIAQLSPIMTIQYAGITSSFDGRVGLEKLTIQVPVLADSVRIAHAELKFNGLGELLRFKERLAEGKFPEQLAATFRGLTLDVHGPFMQQLYAAPVKRSVFTAMSEVACGKVRSIGTLELLEMGYRTFETDAQFSYVFQPGGQKVTFNLSADTRDMGDVRLGMALINMSEKPGDLLANPPRLSQVTFELDDNQYQRKVQEYCAGKLGQTTELYLKTAVAQFDKVLRSQRIALEQPVLDAYEAYLKDPQSMRLELSPTEGMVWDGLQFFAAKDVVGMLKPVLLINQKPVEPLAFAWVDPMAVAGVDADKVPVQMQEPESPEAPEVVATQGFVSVASLPEHIGKRLRVKTFEGMQYQGVLTKLANGKAYLSLQAGNGTAEMSLRLEKIDKVRVSL